MTRSSLTVTVVSMTSGLRSKAPVQVTVMSNSSSSRSGPGSVGSPRIDLAIVSDPVSRVFTKAAVTGPAASVVTSMVGSAAVQPVGIVASSTVQMVPGSSSGSPSAWSNDADPATVVSEAVPLSAPGLSQLQSKAKVASSTTPAGATVVFVIANVLVVFVIESEAPPSGTVTSVPSG